MTYPSEAECQPNIREWREHISEYDPRTELLFSKPDGVHELLDDLVFVQPPVWFIFTATFLG